MSGVFNEKVFNAEVFQGYIERIPNPRRTELIKSRAIRNRPDLAQAMRDQTGGNYIVTPLRGLISGMAPVNYDGATNITAESTVTFQHGRVVVGRAKAWKEDDFSYDLTGGEDFVANIAQQIADYWNEVDQDTLVHVLNGIFNMTGTANLKFVNAHTHDVCNVQNTEGKLGFMDQTTLNTGMQKACGDNKGAFTLVCIHSAVATNLENLKLLTYLKYNDAQGMEREIGLGTLNGRLVLVDDSMPTEEVEAEGDNPAYVKYTSYVLGDGAIEFTDCGCNTPYEVDRDPSTNGGQDLLYSRQRKCFAPYGISFTRSSMQSLSPVDSELEAGANWELVHTMGSTGNRQYIDHKMIPIARIISRG